MSDPQASDQARYTSPPPVLVHPPRAADPGDGGAHWATALRRHGAALCIHDLLAGHPWELTTDWTYVRFHGPNATEHAYQGRYGPDGLFWMAERLSGWLAEGRDVYAYFNNDDSGFAVADVRWLADRLGHRAGARELLKSQVCWSW